MKIFKLGKKNIMAIGDNYNDYELLNESAIAISADESRVKGSFYIPLKGELLPADKFIQTILSLL